MIQLILKRASASRSSSELSDDDYDVLCEGAMVGRIMKATAPVGQPWLWTLAYGHHEDLARPHTATPQRARLRRQRSLRAGGGNRPALPLEAGMLARGEGRPCVISIGRLQG